MQLRYDATARSGDFLSCLLPFDLYYCLVHLTSVDAFLLFFSFTIALDDEERESERERQKACLFPAGKKIEERSRVTEPEGSLLVKDFLSALIFLLFLLLFLHLLVLLLFPFLEE